VRVARWRADPLRFIAHVLCDPESGEPFVLSDAERQFLERAFTLDDHGRLLYPELVFGAIRRAARRRSVLRDWRRRFVLRKVWFDPFQMVSVAQRLAKEHVPIEEYPQTVPNLTAATSNLFDLINARTLALYPTPTCARPSAAPSFTSPRAAGDWTN
jgi:hypothetical protein